MYSRRLMERRIVFVKYVIVTELALVILILLGLGIEMIFE
jgi:hypothetical protein